MLFNWFLISIEINAKLKEYNYYGELLFKGEYLNGIRNGERENIMIIINYYLKENI